MQTVKQIERLWTGRRYEALLRELGACRADGEVLQLIQNGCPATAPGSLHSSSPGNSMGSSMGSSSCVPAAAMAMIRLDELNQAGAPVYHKFLLCLLAAQEADGGWGDPVLSALCLRALLGSRGGGEAIERGLLHLANLQKVDGIWPRIPFRRMPADALASAAIMHQLSHEARFRDAVRFDAAVHWFETHQSQLDAQTRKLWLSVCLRCGIHRGRAATLWSAAC